MLASTVTVTLFMTAAYHNLLCSIVLHNIINTVTIIMPKYLSKTSLHKLTEVVPLKISSLKVSTEQHRKLHKLLTSQHESGSGDRRKRRDRDPAPRLMTYALMQFLSQVSYSNDECNV